jgi:hypothetical protein
MIRVVSGMGGQAASLVVAMALLASVASAAPQTTRTLDPCPTMASTMTVYDASAVADAAFLAIKRLFPRFNYGQGRTTPVTRKTTLFREIIELNRTSSDALRFRQLAARRCGPATARRSWAVVADFPDAPMATTSQIAVFVVDTARGWRLYGSVLDRY